jgi:hypothetical protein
MQAAGDAAWAVPTEETKARRLFEMKTVSKIYGTVKHGEHKQRNKVHITRGR